MARTGKFTRKERLRRCYCHEELDRPGVYTRAGYPANDSTYDRLRAFMNANTELKSAWYDPTFLTAPKRHEYVEPHTADFDRQVTILETPAGKLRATHLVSRKGQPGLHEEYLLKNPEDAEKYLSLPMPKISGDVASFFDKVAEMGDAGIVEAAPRMSPAGIVAELFGSEGFAMMSVTDRDMLHALIKREADITAMAVKHLIKEGVGPFFAFAGEEYIVPPLHGPGDFADFVVKYEKPVFDIVHDAGGRVHVHSHGSVKLLIGQFVEMGVDVLHPFEAPPCGNILPQEAKSAARGRMTLEGNIQIADMYEKSPDDIAEQTRALIRICFDDRRGLIVSPTASPYIRGEGENCYPAYEAMVNTVLTWKA